MRDMKPIGEVLSQVIATPERRPVVREALPAPAALSPDAATSLGSQLLQGGQPELAFTYLARGVRGRPTAFAWCRLGKLMLDVDESLAAVQCYDEALALDPLDPFALVGSARALARWPESSISELVAALDRMSGLIGSSTPLSLVVSVACDLLAAVARQFPHPMLLHRLRDLRQLAREVRSASPDRRHEMERRLDAALRVQELIDEARPHPQLRAVGSQPQVPEREVKALDPGL